MVFTESDLQERLGVLRQQFQKSVTAVEHEFEVSVTYLYLFLSDLCCSLLIYILLSFLPCRFVLFFQDHLNWLQAVCDGVKNGSMNVQSILVPKTPGKRRAPLNAIRESLESTIDLGNVQSIM